MTRLHALCFCAALGLPAAASAETVNVFCWSDYLPAEQRAAFTAETGIEVVYDVFDSNELLETKLLAGASQYDVVCPNAAPHLARMIAADLFLPLDRALLPGWGHLDAGIAAQMDAVADPGNRFAVPWMWGAYAIGRVPEKIDAIMPDAPVDSLRMIFDPEVVSRFAACGVDIVDNPTDVIAMALIHLGLDPASQAPEDMEKVAALLRGIRPYIRSIHASAYYGAMAEGETCLALGFSGDFGIAAARTVETGQSFTVTHALPVEGSILFVDSWTIPRDAPNPAGAHRFIDFTLRPEVAAAATEALFYANANAAALPLLDSALREDPTLFPPPDLRARMRIAAPVEAGARRRMLRLWDDFRAGR
jgi:putrescine transport system substrate-binding protein